LNLLSKIDITTEAVEMEVLDLHGKPLTDEEAQKPKLYIYGADSDVFSKARDKWVEDGMTEDLTLLVPCVEKWVNIKDDNGIDMPFTKENTHKLLKRYPVIKTQINIFIKDRENYLKKS